MLRIPIRKISRAMSSFEADYCEYDEIVRLLKKVIRSIRLKELENMREISKHFGFSEKKEGSQVFM